MKNIIWILILIIGLSACNDDENPNQLQNGGSDTELPLQLEVNFDNGTYAPLLYTTGRTDNPADADPEYKAEVSNQELVYSIPNSNLRPKLSGFLDLPAENAPIEGEMIHEFTFTDASQLRDLAQDANSLAIAGCYIRGNYTSENGKDWENGDTFGGFWFGFVKNTDASLQSVIRQGATNIVSETFTANDKVSYQIHKVNKTLTLSRKYDNESEWTEVGKITLTIRTGGSETVYITHTRVLNNSDEAISVKVDDFKWYY